MRFTVVRRLVARDVFLWGILPLLAFAILWKGGKSLETTWLLTGVAWLAAVDGLRRQQAPPVPRWLAASALGFILWTLLSLLTSATANYGLDELLRDGSCVVLFLWAAGRFAQRSKDDLRQLMTVLRNTMLAASGIGLLVYVVQPVSRFVGTFFDYRFHTDYWPNAWAECLLLAWPLAVASAAAAGNGKGKARRRWYSAGVLLGALALSYSRGAIIAACGQVALGAALLWLADRREFVAMLRPRLGRTAMLVLMAVLLFISANALRSQRYSVEDVTEKVTFTAAEGASSVSERRQFWGQAWTLSLQRPLLGWGPYSFRFVQPQFQRSVLATADHPHNVILKYASERGWPAALLFLAVIGGIALRVWRRWRETMSTEDRRLLLAVTLAVAGVLAHNLIDFNLQFVGIVLPFWMFLGLLLAFSKGKKMNTKVIQKASLLLATLLLVIALVDVPPMITSSLGRHAQSAGDDDAALRWYDTARRQWLSRDLHLSRAQLFLAAERYDDAASALDAYEKQNAVDARATALRAALAEARGNRKEAAMLYDEALEWNRWNDLHLLAARLRIARLEGEDLSARKEEEDALLDAYADAIERNVHFITLGPNVEALLQVTEQLIKLFPADEPRYRVLGARIERRANRERQRFAARPPGWLW